MRQVSHKKSIDYKAGNDAKITEGTDASSYNIDKLAACRYGFVYQAGKTYVLFQNNEMLGFYGFTFGASSTEATNVSISQADGYTYEAKNNADGNPYQTTQGKCMECHLSAIQYDRAAGREMHSVRMFRHR